MMKTKITSMEGEENKDSDSKREIVTEIVTEICTNLVNECRTVSCTLLGTD